MIDYKALISIHALREESDPVSQTTMQPCTGFQSTPSARRATSCAMLHSPFIFYFNPLPPRGERLAYKWLFVTFTVFQSTPSARRATRSGAHPETYG